MSCWILLFVPSLYVLTCSICVACTSSRKPPLWPRTHSCSAPNLVTDDTSAAEVAFTFDCLVLPAFAEGLWLALLQP